MAKDWPVLIDDEEKGYEIEIMASSLETIFASYLERFPNPLIKILRGDTAKPICNFTGQTCGMV